MDYYKLLVAPLFKGLNITEIGNIIASVPHQSKKYPAGSMIAQSGELVNSLMVVLNGTAKGEMIDYAGRVIKIEDIPAPGALASAFMFGSRNRFPVNVIAVTDVEILMIEKSHFLVLLMKNDIILANFLDMISNRSQFLSEKIKFLNFKTIKGKLAQFILQRSAREGSTVTLGMTQNELADFFGVARPSVARAIGLMEEEGLLEARGRNIRILDSKRLSGLMTD